MSAHIKRTERSQINDLMLHLKHLEKHVTSKTQNKQRRELVKIRSIINEIETNKQTKTKESMKQKAGSL
jgi:hypothetical protein